MNLTSSEDQQSQPSSLLRVNRELAILYEIAGYLNRQVDVVQALHEVLGRVTELLGLRTGWVWLIDNNRKATVVASQHLPPYLADHPERMTGSCHCLDTFMGAEQAGAANIDVLRCSRLKKAEVESDPTALGLRFHASVPIHAGPMLLGVMNVASEDWRELQPEELQLLHIISDQIGLALQRARLSTQQTLYATRIATIEERNRLAREIHDTLAQGLTAIALQLEIADTLATIKPDRAQEAIQRALKLARNNLEEARRSVMDLRAGPLQDHTLPEALAILAESKDGDPIIQYTYSPTLNFPLLPTRVEVGLYRIAQEAITNVHKHAQAQKIDIQLVAEETWVSLIIHDDGCGFDPEQIAVVSSTHNGHFGLTGMAERARLLGGSICIASQPGAGTLIEVSVPY